LRIASQNASFHGCKPPICIYMYIGDVNLEDVETGSFSFFCTCLRHSF